MKMMNDAYLTRTNSIFTQVVLNSRNVETVKYFASTLNAIYLHVPNLSIHSIVPKCINDDFKP